MPCPLPRWTETGASVGCFPAPLGPSPLFRRVGVHDFTFKACSGFTHVTACRIAQPPNGGLCHEASARPVTQPSRSSTTRVYRQLPGWILPPLVNRAVGAHWIRRARIDLQRSLDRAVGIIPRSAAPGDCFVRTVGGSCLTRMVNGHRFRAGSVKSIAQKGSLLGTRHRTSPVYAG